VETLHIAQTIEHGIKTPKIIEGTEKKVKDKRLREKNHLQRNAKPSLREAVCL